MPAIAPIQVACFICGTQAMLPDEKPSHADFDCPECGRLRVTGRAMFVFPPSAMRAFDRPWLSGKARAITGTPQNGSRKLVNDLWLHHWRLVTLLMVDYGLTEAEAQAHLERYPDADTTNESVLALVGRGVTEA